MKNSGRKRAVPRHRVMCKQSAHRCEKAIEVRVRQDSKRECEEQEEEYERSQEEQGLA